MNNNSTVLTFQTWHDNLYYVRHNGEITGTLERLNGEWHFEANNFTYWNAQCLREILNFMNTH